MGSDIIIVIAIIIVAILALVFIPRFMINRAIRSVIRIFRERNAVTILGAKTIEELGLSPKSFLQGLFAVRDYKPDALQVLHHANIIRTTEDGKVYLDEGQLQISRWASKKT
jgi:hypothetical protein